ncbi:IucC family-domain-containing protein [Amylostereum chailletii]|nr:IucC family-domain-containing protein [Amylostereum chailletii]
MSSLAPQPRAVFATTARLISCLVTETLARALYVPLPASAAPAIGVAVVLSGHASSKPPAEYAAYAPTDVLTIVPLKHVPVLKHDGTDPRAKEIGLLDPLDMLPAFLLIDDGKAAIAADVPSEYAGLAKALPDALSGSGWALGDPLKLRLSTSATDVWDKFASSLALESALQADIAEELASSVLWQAYSFEHPPRGPAFESPSIDWEQSIVEGHPTHPMHKTRAFLPPIPDIAPGGYDLYHPRIRLAALPRTSLNVTGDFESYVAPIVAGAEKNAQQKLVIPEGHVVVPVHELQVHHVQAKFPEAQIFPAPFSVSALAQQSIRSVILPGTLTNTSLKLGVGIKLTSAVRTISPASAYLGPRFSSQVVPALTMDPKILTVAKELASAVHNHSDGEIAKHCAAIIRECHENDSEARGERLIVCTSLVESGHEGVPAGVPSIIRVFGLDTEAKRLQWLDDFVRVFFAAFLPPMLHNGVGFEAHPQNTVARFSLASPPKLLGFIIRDFGGLRVHPETLRASTGVELDVAPNHSIIADSMDDVYTRMYHTVVHNHLQQLVRVLGLHYNGKGWDVVRKRLREAIPAGHSLERAWLGPEAKTLPGKCFMRMRMVGMYRYHLHSPFLNLLHYKGENNDVEDGALDSGKANGAAA